MKNLWIAVILVLIFNGCRKSDNLSEIPKITFVSLTANQNSSGKDTLGILVFDYEDGDGDLGALSTDSLSLLNLFITFYEKKNGVFTAPVLPPPGFDARIPNLTPKAKNKSISGDITRTLLLPPGVIKDTIKFTVYLVDRANHKSNEIETSELVITTQ
ncbi:MAG: hypothetical protein ABI723_20690 [Bacteroidia bacterium]